MSEAELPEAWRETTDRAARDEAARQARRIGSTDIAVIAAYYNPALGSDLPKTKTAADVFARLRWGLEPTRNARMERGLSMEHFGLDYYRQHVGPWWRALPLGEWWTVADAVNPDFTASPDAYDSPEPRIVVELKTQSEWARPQWGEPGTDQMATRYLYQAQWLLARCNARQAHVLCIFGNDVPVDEPEPNGPKTFFQVTEPAIYVVDRDDELGAQLDAYAERFLNDFVRTGVPPLVKSAHTRAEMKRRLNAEGIDAADWYERCEAHAAEHGLDEWGRPKAKSRDEDGGGDGLR